MMFIWPLGLTVQDTYNISRTNQSKAKNFYGRLNELRNNYVSKSHILILKTTIYDFINYCDHDVIS